MQQISQFNEKILIKMLKNIKSPYILGEIFSYLSLNNELRLVKHNKQHQALRNISINTYKEYNQIEILITLIDKTDGYILNYNNTFINFNDKDSSYFHIYLNESKNEIKSNIVNYKNVKKIRVLID